MKIFTRLFLIAFLMVARLAFATTHIVQVSNNQYSPQNLTVNQGDIVQFQWHSGSNQTMSNTNAWPMFQMNSSNTVKALAMNSAGTYDYHSMNTAGMSGSIVVRVVSGLKDIKTAPTLNAYPNPTRGETTITINQAGSEKYTIRISNAIGRMVKTVEVPQNATEGISVDISNLPSGFYFYSLLVNDKMLETKRLILQR
jgi:plastocyanin